MKTEFNRISRDGRPVVPFRLMEAQGTMHFIHSLQRPAEHKLIAIAIIQVSMKRLRVLKSSMRVPGRSV